ncbi:MAG TPA: DUF2760 domain-containing protein [Blastocatellia bacterium]
MGFGKRLSLAFRTFFAILGGGEAPREAAAERIAPAEQTAREIAPAAETTDRALQMLAILQRDGRLIDFFSEEIAPYTDAQIGAAVRDLHQNCRNALERYVKLEPIIASDEGEPVTVQSPFDPASIKLIGNVTGTPPLRGVLRHRGWRATAVNLPPLAEGAARAVIAPAEVEIP